MSDSDQPFVFSAVEVVSVETIDSGRTIVVRFRRPDDGEAAVLLAVPLAQDLSRRITEALGSLLPIV